MPRIARNVIPGVAHHVTQRGNRRQQTFFSPADYARYIELVAEGCQGANVEVLAWCLMPNHVHLILIPRDEAGLGSALAGPHQRYTWLVNRRNGWQGYLWQSRFYSCPLDDKHLRLAIRYVELNPVRAKLVNRPEDWRWSSTKGHIADTGDSLVGTARPRAVADVMNWSQFLAEGIAEDKLERMRSLHHSGRPRGRPRRQNGDTHHFQPGIDQIR